MSNIYKLGVSKIEALLYIKTPPRNPKKKKANNQNSSFIQILQKRKVNHNDAEKEDVIEKKVPENRHDVEAVLNKKPEESKFIIDNKYEQLKQEKVDMYCQDAEDKKVPNLL